MQVNVSTHQKKIVKSMKRELIKLTYEIELQPGEQLNLPASLLENVGAGRWVITIEQEPTAYTNTRSHDAFLFMLRTRRRRTI